MWLNEFFGYEDKENTYLSLQEMLIKHKVIIKIVCFFKIYQKKKNKKTKSPDQ